MTWYIYIVECSDHSLYTGITTDIERRIKEHNTDNKLGAKYTHYKRPVILKYSEDYQTQSEARKREAEIKNWRRENKIKLILGKPKKKGLP